jgi:ABC-type amino acid transport substrate-binding protein
VELMRRFAQRLGVSYEFVQTGWAEALPELVGRRARRRGPEQGQRARVIIRGDVVATGMTRLGGRSPGVVFSTPVLPAQVWVVAAADSTVSPIRPSGRLEEDIRAVKARLAGRALLAVPGTSLDPSLYGLAKTGARLRLLKLQLDEVAPALIQGEAELALLEVEDATTALERYPGRIKVIGPVSGQQAMAVAFRAGAPQLREAFEAFLAEAHRDGSYDGLVAAYFPGAPAYFREFFAEPF